MIYKGNFIIRGVVLFLHYLFSPLEYGGTEIEINLMSIIISDIEWS